VSREEADAASKETNRRHKLEILEGIEVSITIPPPGEVVGLCAGPHLGL